MDTNTLMLGVLFGSVGLGMFVYGKRQQKYLHLIAGLALMVCPYFIPGALWLAIVGVALVVLPFAVR